MSTASPKAVNRVRKTSYSESSTVAVVTVIAGKEGVSYCPDATFIYKICVLPSP